MPLIVDASAILSQAYEDEDASYAEAVIAEIIQQTALTSKLFWFEIRNALIMGERRGRMTSDQSETFLSLVGQLPIVVDDALVESVVLELARYHKLTVYDATYLELAKRRGFPLATVDKALIQAARESNVAIWAAPTV